MPKPARTGQSASKARSRASPRHEPRSARLCTEIDFSSLVKWPGWCFLFGRLFGDGEMLASSCEPRRGSRSVPLRGTNLEAHVFALILISRAWLSWPGWCFLVRQFIGDGEMFASSCEPRRGSLRGASPRHEPRSALFSLRLIWPAKLSQPNPTVLFG